MNYPGIMSSLMMANELPLNERYLAETLMSSSSALNFFAKAKEAEIVLTVSSAVPDHVTRAIINSIRIPCAILPVTMVKLMSPSPVETAKFASITVCSLLKRLFKDRNKHFRGVLAIDIGISVNNMPTPGALIWRLQECSFMRFTASSLGLISSVSYVDSFTLTSRVKSTSTDKTMEERSVSPTELISNALEIFGTESTTNVAVEDVVETIKSLIPKTYLRIV